MFNRDIKVECPLNKEELSKDNLFLDIMRKLIINKLITNEDVELIKIQILELLKSELNYFTRGESSSVREEVAENILLSIYFNIGTYFGSLENIMDSIKVIKNKSIVKIYNEGKELIEIKYLKAKKLMSIVDNNKIITKNYAYNDTLDEGISRFFNEYDMRFATHIAPCFIDYPLFEDINDFVGIDYIYEYLKRINIENQFCLYFNKEDIELLLDNYEKDCDKLLINIFTIVLTNSIGSILSGKSAKNLYLTKEDINYIETNIRDENNIKDIIRNAIEKILIELGIMDEFLKSYIINASDEIDLNIKNAKILNNLEKVFIEIKEIRKNNLIYVDSETLDNESFRNIVNEVKCAKSIDEKIEIIRKEIHSLEDLVDVLDGDCIFESEFINIFKSLEDIEIALLLKYSGILIDRGQCIDFHKQWQNIIYKFFCDLDKDKKIEIVDLYNNIEF